MTDTEKVTWTVEVFRQCDVTEDYIQEKIKDVEIQKEEIK